MLSYYYSHSSPQSDQIQELDSMDESLRDAYWRKAADVNAFGEQLAEHNYDYWTTLADRDRRLDQGEKLSIPDEEFQAEAARARTIISQALEKSNSRRQRAQGTMRNSRPVSQSAQAQHIEVERV